MSEPESNSPNQEEKQPANKNPENIELSPEVKELEKRLSASMLVNINKCIADGLKPIKDSIEKIMNSSAQIDQQYIEIKWLNVENSVLKSQVKELRSDMDSIKLKLSHLENKSLECNLIFRGINESLNETEDSLREKLHQHIADTFNYQDEQSWLATSRNCQIRRCRRLG